MPRFAYALVPSTGVAKVKSRRDYGLYLTGDLKRRQKIGGEAVTRFR
jgi:hypothetical protein